MGNHKDLDQVWELVGDSFKASLSSPVKGVFQMCAGMEVDIRSNILDALALLKRGAGTKNTLPKLLADIELAVTFSIISRERADKINSLLENT